MNTPSNAMPGSPRDSQIKDTQVSESHGTTPAVISATQHLYWSVRRELWESRSIYIAPLAAAALILFGFSISTIRLPGKMRATALNPMLAHELIETPYDLAALLIMGTTLIVAIFYCLDALHGERRDRSILFWKSLPVSDLITVLAKASIPIVILPLLTFTITIATQGIMLLISGAVLLGSGLSVASLWTHLSFVQMSWMLFYHLVAMHGLWYAPIYGWLLLVSGWARRAAFVWATLPLFAIGIFEKIAFNTSHFAGLLGYRISGGGADTGAKATGMSMALLTHLTPTQFITSSGLWAGLAITAVFLFAAVRFRRHRGPI